MPEDSPESAAVRRAKAALEAGEAWRARDTLLTRVSSERDMGALDLLGQVLYDMGDLPAAGAVWFGTPRKGTDVEAATSAWRDRHGDDFGDMWRSLPPSVRARPRTPRVEALRAKAKEADLARSEAVRSDPVTAEDAAEAKESGGFDAAQFIAWLLAALFVVCAIVGLVVILRWIVPGA